MKYIFAEDVEQRKTGETFESEIDGYVSVGNGLCLKIRDGIERGMVCELTTSAVGRLLKKEILLMGESIKNLRKSIDRFHK